MTKMNISESRTASNKKRSYGVLKFKAKAINCLKRLIENTFNHFRLVNLRLQGATIGRRVKIGKSFAINWPHQLFICDGASIGDNVTILVDGIFDTAGSVHIGCETEIRPYVRFFKKQDNLLNIGKNAFIGEYSFISAIEDIHIGDGCLLAAMTVISDTNHNYHPDIQDRKHSITSRPIRIEEQVWIGLQSCVLQGVIIERGSVVAAGSVVNRDIPPLEMWGGVPCRKIKTIEKST